MSNTGIIQLIKSLLCIISCSEKIEFIEKDLCKKKQSGKGNYTAFLS
jgi:hypothetical protein